MLEGVGPHGLGGFADAIMPANAASNAAAVRVEALLRGRPDSITVMCCILPLCISSYPCVRRVQAVRDSNPAHTIPENHQDTRIRNYTFSEVLVPHALEAPKS